MTLVELRKRFSEFKDALRPEKKRALSVMSGPENFNYLDLASHEGDLQGMTTEEDIDKALKKEWDIDVKEIDDELGVEGKKDDIGM